MSTNAFAARGGGTMRAQRKSIFLMSSVCWNLFVELALFGHCLQNIWKGFLNSVNIFWIPVSEGNWWALSTLTIQSERYKLVGQVSTFGKSENNHVLCCKSIFSRNKKLWVTYQVSSLKRNRYCTAYGRIYGGQWAERFMWRAFMNHRFSWENSLVYLMHWLSTSTGWVTTISPISQCGKEAT